MILFVVYEICSAYLLTNCALLMNIMSTMYVCHEIGSPFDALAVRPKRTQIENGVLISDKGSSLDYNKAFVLYSSILGSLNLLIQLYMGVMPDFPHDVPPETVAGAFATLGTHVVRVVYFLWTGQIALFIVIFAFYMKRLFGSRVSRYFEDLRRKKEERRREAETKALEEASTKEEILPQKREAEVRAAEDEKAAMPPNVIQVATAIETARDEEVVRHHIIR